MVEDVVFETSNNVGAELGAADADLAHVEIESATGPDLHGSPESSTLIELAPVSARINTYPPSEFSIDGIEVGSTWWTGELIPGLHTIEMTSIIDGRVQQTEVTVRANSDYAFCWQFDTAGPCPR